MKILIICDAQEKLAAELIFFMKREAEKMNRRVLVLDVNDSSHRPVEFDAIVVTCEMRGDELGSNVNDYIRANLSAMNLLPTFFLPVIPVEGDEAVDRELMKFSTRQLLMKLQWAPQQILRVPFGSDFHNEKLMTQANLDKLKLALQRFLVRNDVEMKA